MVLHPRIFNKMITAEMISVGKSRSLKVQTLSDISTTCSFIMLLLKLYHSMVTIICSMVILYHFRFSVPVILSLPSTVISLTKKEPLKVHHHKLTSRCDFL